MAVDGRPLLRRFWWSMRGNGLSNDFFSWPAYWRFCPLPLCASRCWIGERNMVSLPLFFFSFLYAIGLQMLIKEIHAWQFYVAILILAKLEENTSPRRKNCGKIYPHAYIFTYIYIHAHKKKKKLTSTKMRNKCSMGNNNMTEKPREKKRIFPFKFIGEISASCSLLFPK